MAYFDATSLWGGDPDKANASIEHDFANSEITIGSGGQITNKAGDFSLDDSGLSYQVPDDTLDISKSTTWQTGGSVVAQIGAAHETAGSIDILEYQSEYHRFKADGNTILSMQHNLAIFNEPPVVPRMTTTERDNLTVPTGAIIFNTTANRFQGRDFNGNWKDITQ